MKRSLLLILCLGLIAAGCSSSERLDKSAGAKQAATCRWQGDWQRLANRIKADVYCPSWLPDPLTGDIGGPWNNIDSVSKDRSYLMGFVWQERGEEIHINLRGYPGTTKVPSCRSVELVGGKKHEKQVPCFDDSRGEQTIGGYRVTKYTVNQDADQWHVLYAWKHNGGLYTLSEHIAPPLTVPHIIRNMNRMMSSLVLVRPKS